ncbi:MAG: 23S rRNA (uracil(1939)-C(5))-methyltransferase RlmD [Thermoleophilia bacterium]|nr:23S rRNA (uracil(1939)-C(5))-methyltransferase RlmD [Thermoleophilia bacterium]
MPPRPGDMLDLEVTTLAYGGRGVARVDDFVVFVRGALPGDRVRARVTKRKRRHAEARAVELLRPSAERVAPRCRHAGECGGCEWQSLAYERQLEAKQSQVVEALAHLGGLDDYELEPILGMPDPWRYRNKMEFSFGVEESRLVLGLHRKGSWSEIVEVEDCLLASERMNTARAAVAAAARELGLTAYDRGRGARPGQDGAANPAQGAAEASSSVETADAPRETADAPRETADGTAAQTVDASSAAETVDASSAAEAADASAETDTGLLRHLVVREGRTSGDLLLNLYVRRRFPKEEALVEAVMARCPVTSFAVTVNASPADAAVGDGPHMLAGPPSVRERLAGVDLRVPATAFLQTNTQMTDLLYETAAGFAGLSPAAHAVDLYCGIGSFSLRLARDAAHVTGIELQPEAVEAARVNAELNGTAHVAFFAGDVRRLLKDPSAVDLDPAATPLDVVAVDPPRAGLVRKALQRAAALGAERFVYISCNPATLAGNARELSDVGYRLSRVRPVDMFPHTHHVETVALFVRKET